MGLKQLRGMPGLAAALLLALVAVAHGRAAPDFKREFAVDLGKYLGLWHEIARVPNGFQDNEPRKDGRRFSACYHATAEYARTREERISVTNACLRKAEDGTVSRDVARGMARVIEGSQNRRLQVAFGPPFARFIQRLFGPSEGNYWIHCLGPEADARYSWSVVSDHRGKLVWFLAREPSVPNEVKSEMLACARKAGLRVDELIYTRRAG